MVMSGSSDTLFTTCISVIKIERAFQEIPIFFRAVKRLSNPRQNKISIYCVVIHMNLCCAIKTAQVQIVMIELDHRADRTHPYFTWMLILVSIPIQ